MAKVLSKKTISIKDGGKALHEFLDQYQAEFVRTSSTEKGHVYWVPGLSQWILVMRKGKNAQLTFHPRDDCPCQLL